MVLCKVLKSKVEIDIAFFLAMILFSLVAIGKQKKFLENFWKQLGIFVMKNFCHINNHFEIFGYCIRK